LSKLSLSQSNTDSITIHKSTSFFFHSSNQLVKALDILLIWVKYPPFAVVPYGDDESEAVSHTPEYVANPDEHAIGLDTDVPAL
jgi:hypothetical protein